ncbi:amino acid ABC transporter ATP-binding/permease protein [Pseudazoarcus pumilus]|nr:ATP-binding cassette domain-containing protein [Pseudazoarcus pumilus]
MRRSDPLHVLLVGGRRWLAATAALLALTWVAGVALLALSGWFVTASALAGLGALAGLNIFTPAAGIRAAALLRTVARYGERVVGHEAVLRRLAELRCDAFERIASLPPVAQRRLRSGDWQTRLVADIDTLDAVPLRVIAPTLAALASTGFAAALAGWLAGWTAATLVIGVAVAVLCAAMFAGRAGRRCGEALVAGRARERIALLDHVDGMAELAVYGRLDASRATLAELARTHSRRLDGQSAVAALAEHAVQALVGLGTLAMLALALSAHVDGSISGPVAVLLALMVLGLGEALASLPGAGWRLGESLAAAARLDFGGAVLADDVQPRGDAGAAITARALVVGFDARRPLWHGLDLDLEPGVPLLVCGPSGSGKSALLATLAGELDPLAGQVRIGDRALAECGASDVALLAQDTVLLDASVFANLRLARPDVDAHEASRLLLAVGLDEFADGGTRGLRTRVGEGAANLSGGQARRVLLAWLLLRDPALALLDEPFSGLDEAARERAMSALEPWLVRRCAVIATHEPECFPAHWPRIERR